jgi:predicted transcriptional regulator
METTTETSEMLLSFFKALADANRLKIIGLLAQGQYSVEELASLLELGPSTVSHHLSRLSEVGLVCAQAESYYNIYRLEPGVLENMAKKIFSKETLSAVAADVDLDAYDRDVLKNYLDENGHLAQIPTQRKKLFVVLRYIGQAFEADREYTEKEVNTIIGQYHTDSAGLRRDMVDVGCLTRDRRGTSYQFHPDKLA